MNWWCWSGQGLLFQRYLQALDINLSPDKISYILKHNIPRQSCVRDGETCWLNWLKFSPLGVESVMVFIMKSSIRLMALAVSHAVRVPGIVLQDKKTKTMLVNI